MLRNWRLPPLLSKPAVPHARLTNSLSDPHGSGNVDFPGRSLFATRTSPTSRNMYLLPRECNGHRCRRIVPGAGVEPAWPCGRGILSPLRIPVSPPGPGWPRHLAAEAIGMLSVQQKTRTWRVSYEISNCDAPAKIAERKNTRNTLKRLEAWVGIEPAYADLQSAAEPLCHQAGDSFSASLWPGRCDCTGAPEIRARIKRNPGGPGLAVSGAGNETRTRDLNLGKVALYQLSYSRGRGGILTSRAGLSTATPSPARKTGHAARR